MFRLGLLCMKRFRGRGRQRTPFSYQSTSGWSVQPSKRHALRSCPLNERTNATLSIGLGTKLKVLGGYGSVELVELGLLRPHDAAQHRQPAQQTTIHYGKEFNEHGDLSIVEETEMGVRKPGQT